jgi:uncharacterized protein (DUF2141 family)
MNSPHTHRLAIGLLCLGLASATQAQTATPTDPATPTAVCRAVNVLHVRPGQGQVMVSAFLSAADFEAKRPAAAATLRAGPSESATLMVCGLGGNHMALLVTQDLNSNGQLDRNVMGIPIEPWGASGTPPTMSAPTFEALQVPVASSPLTVALSK